MFEEKNVNCISFGAIISFFCNKLIINKAPAYINKKEFRADIHNLYLLHRGTIIFSDIF